MAIIDRILRRYAYRTGKFTLASGAESGEYLDLRAALLHPRAGARIADIAARELARDWPHFDAVAGVAVGAVPLAVLVAARLDYYDAMALIVRPEPKSHGLGGAVDGLSNLGDARRVVLLEDVVTGGGSTLRALAQLADPAHRLNVLGVLAVVDRGQGGLDAIRAAHPGLRVEALTTLSDVRAAEPEE